MPWKHLSVFTFCTFHFLTYLPHSDTRWQEFLSTGKGLREWKVRDGVLWIWALQPEGKAAHWAGELHLSAHSISLSGSLWTPVLLPHCSTPMKLVLFLIVLMEIPERASSQTRGKTGGSMFSLCKQETVSLPDLMLEVQPQYHLHITAEYQGSFLYSRSADHPSLPALSWMGFLECLLIGIQKGCFTWRLRLHHDTAKRSAFWPQERTEVGCSG